MLVNDIIYGNSNEVVFCDDTGCIVSESISDYLGIPNEEVISSEKEFLDNEWGMKETFTTKSGNKIVIRTHMREDDDFGFRIALSIKLEK